MTPNLATTTATSSTTASDLFNSVALGPYTLANRIVMAPLTRSRASSGGVPGTLHAQYYAQRASAGLIIAEATNISPQGRGYAFTPGIYTDEQVAGWKLTTDAVHAKGGRIVLQLWHVGRYSHPALQENGALPVAPSAIRPKGQAFTEQGMLDVETPRALETNEIAGVVADYRHAAQCALRAGFDGVEIHAANGYLLDQFLRDSTNHRSDAYGGSSENRARIVREVVSAVVAVWGASRVGIRLSPTTTFGDAPMDSTIMQTYGGLIDAIAPLGLMYLHLIEGETGGSRDLPAGVDLQNLRQRFSGPLMLNNGYTRDMALAARQQHKAELICFGRPFIANPDLVARLASNAPLAALNPKTLYGGGAAGYTDYPALA
ncbi:MAG: alkene reductase [Burkholderiales bacterium]